MAALAIENDLVVLSDEIYEDIIYDGARHLSIAGYPGMKPRTIVVNGFSKNFSMTGWRLGYAAADRELTQALIRIHQYTTVCATTFAQWGGVAALTAPRTTVEEMVVEFDRRRQFVNRELSGIPKIKVNNPRGTFYFMVDISGFDLDSEQMSFYLLNEAGCATVPGTAFGEYGKGFIRISFATSMAQLEIGIKRIHNALKQLAG
jgi:aspartate/methionine/tyrosine aminotransferase